VLSSAKRLSLNVTDRGHEVELRGVQQHDLTQAAWCSDDRTELNDTRTSVVGAGAAVVAGSLWAPWYAIDFGPAARQAVGAQTDQLPGVLGELTRQLLTVMRP